MNTHLTLNTQKIIISFLLFILAFVAVIVISKLSLHSKGNKKESLTIGMVTFPGYGPLYLAQEKGFFGNTRINLTRIENPNDLRSALSSGSIDGYIATHDMFMSVVDKKPQGTAIAMIDTSKGADGIIVDESINTIADLKGKEIAIEPGFPAYLLLQYELSNVGMKLSDVIVKDMTTIDATSAFVSKSVSAAGLYEPNLSSSLIARKGSKILTSTDNKELLPHLASDLLFMNPHLIQQKPDALRDLVSGYFKALDYIKTNPNESYEIMGKAFGMSTQEMQEFHSKIVWSDKSEQEKLFNQNNTENIFKTFTLVNKLLLNNDNTNLTFSAHEHISNTIINSLQEF